MSRRAAHWIVLVVGLVGAAWLLWTLGLTVGERAAYGGLSVLPTSPTIQHKIGLLLISAPLWATALTRASRPDRDAARILARGWPVILIDGEHGIGDLPPPRALEAAGLHQEAK